ncbi:phage tail length tape measure family protein [Mesorhizobium sp. B2-8-5]|uniref:phage tail length tape measure family protein n=1 Tax=Mesorhizobium sp. B2-8-5 TaxID=2589903 RepID=UPI001D001F85|nr:phage tail length tape measure family protein [Mesorhizobium sp. B2-8-5]UCI23677.1 phage tail length tape measure family protein [Mesorhizobium sp. B2-8-5]
MAGDTEDLILSISADTKQIQRALQRLTGDTRATTTAIQQQFDDLGNRTAGAFDNTATRARQSFRVIQGGAKDIQTAMKASSFQTANLGAQLQDIAVQLKGGASPLTIALQQGTQINQVIGQAGAAGAVKALGGAVTSLINPVSLATIATIALVGYAVEYFSEVVSGGDKSAETLKQEAELLDRVAQKWGDALPAVKAYADERKRALEEGDIRQATQLTIDEQFKEARETVKALTVDIADLVSQLRLAGAPNEEIVAVQRAFTALQKAVEDGKDSTKENKALLEALSTAYFNRGVPGPRHRGWLRRGRQAG